MKKIISTCIALMVSAACSISAFAMEVPTNTTIQDLNGVRQYSQIEVSPSVLEPTHDGLTDEERENDFLNILDACELTGFTPGTALVFENAIERLYYSDSYRIGNATLPQSRVRAKLRRLDGMILREAERKLRENQEQNVKNSTAYTMAVLFNCIAESESDLMVDPYLNALSSTA